MGKKIAIVFSMGILICIMVFSYIFVSQYSIHKIQSVNISNYDNGYIYGIDMASDKYYIFRYNTETGKQEFFTYPIEYNGNMVILNDLNLGENGDLYLHRSQTETEDPGTYKDTIEYCDFDEGALTTVWDINEITKDNYFFFYYDKNSNYILLTRDYENINMTTYVLNEDRTGTEISSAPITDSTYMLYIDEGTGKMWALSINGDLGFYADDGSIRNVFYNDGSQIGIDNYNYEFLNNNAYFVNLETGYSYKITQETNYKELEPYFEKEGVNPKTFDVSKMYNISEKDGVYYGVLALDDGRNVPAIYGEKEYVLDQLSWTQEKVIIATIFLFLVISSILFIYIYIFYKLLKRIDGAPVLGIVTLLIIPIIMIGITNLFHYIDNKQSDEKIQKIQELTVLSEILKEKVDVETFQKLSEKRRLSFDEVFNLQYKLNEGQNIINLESNINEYINETAYGILYFYKNNELFSASTYYQMDIPISYQVPANSYLCMKEAAEKNRIVSTEYNDLAGRYISVFTPIEDQDGEVIGVLEVNDNIISLELSMLNNKETIKKLILTAAVLIFIVIQMVLWINTRPLKALRQAMTDIAGGNLTARANIHGNHEIAVIADEFDKMAELIENRVDEMEAFQKKYEAFVPSKLFYFLRKNGIKEAFVGDGKNFTATVMALNSSGYKEAVTKKYDEVFSYSNNYLKKQIPVIHSYGGIIRRIFEGGEETIFTKEKQNNVVECAIELMQKLSDSNEGFCIGIAKEDLRFGVIGLPERMVTVTISEHGSLSWFLQQMASKFEIPILITGNAANEIENFFDKYSTRTIGYLYMTSTNRLEVIYEVLDGNSQQHQRLKLDTKSDFEEGVRLFMAKSYIYARKRFVYVLQKDKNDGAAREYIFLCDMRIKETQTDDPWLDKF